MILQIHYLEGKWYYHPTMILLVTGIVHQFGSPEQFTKKAHFTLYEKCGNYANEPSW